MKKHLTAILVLIIFTNSFGQSHGTSSNWTIPSTLPKPNALGDMTKGGIGQNIIQLSTGELIQCFTETFPYPSGPTKIYLLKSNDDGLTWGALTNYSPTSKTNIPFVPTIAKDTSDNIHMVWQRNLPNKAIYYSKMDKNFNVLIDTVKISDYSFHNNFESLYITVDRENRVHIMWHDGDTDQPSSLSYFSKVMYKQSPDGGFNWANQKILSDTTSYNGMHSGFPRANFVGASGDTIAIPWRQEKFSNSTDWDVWMAYSTDGGINWDRIIIGNTDSTEWDPGIIVDKNNRIHLHNHEYKKGNLQMTSMEYFYSDNLGVSWSPIQTLSPAGIRSQLSVFAYDYSTNTQCICWKDERDYINSVDSKADIMCSYSTDGGETWFGQEFVTDLDTIPTGFKSIEVGNNNMLYLTFEYPDSTGRKNIHFSKRANTISLIDIKNDNEVKWELFPNPVSNDLFIITPLTDFTIKFFDSKGNLLSTTINGSYIDISSLQNGIYIAVVNYKTGFSAKKIIVQK